MAGSATAPWAAARHVARAKSHQRRPRKDRFAGSSQWHHSVVEGVEVRRLRAWPKGASGPPASWALDPALHCSWRRCRPRGIPLGLQWWQAAESRLMFRFALPQGARCHGLGERYGGLNLRGRVHTLLSLDDHNHSEATDAMYKSIPLLLITDSGATVGLFLDSPAPQRWDLDRDWQGEGTVELYTRRGFALHVIGPTSLPDAVRAYSHLTGRAALPPRWSLGHQQCRWSYPTEQRVREVAREFRQRRIPCDTIVIDIDYLEDYRVFTISRERFPRFERMVTDLGRQGFRVLTIVDPGVKRTVNDPAYQSGRRANVFCRRPDGKLFVGPVWAGPSCFPDFLRADVRAWYKEQLRFLLSRGVAGIWNDMNEPAIFGQQQVLPAGARELPPTEAQPFVQTAPEGKVGHLEVRNAYGHTMARAAWEAQLEQRPGRRPFVLTRACYAGMQRYGAVWLGDNKSWFEHLRLSIPMLLNMGLSGIPFCGVDIGGFGEHCDAELLVRWYQVGIFYPFFRNHCALGQRAQEPWAFGPKAEAQIRHLIETRYRLLPWIEQLFAEHRATGAPLLRPLAWHAPEDATAAEIDDQFFLGRDLLVAPIVERGLTRRAVYLPQGQWVPFEGGPPLRGGQYHDVPCAFDQIPAFVRRGAIVPLADPVQHTGELPGSRMVFRAYGPVAYGIYREDDGASLNYDHGVYNEWQLRVRAGQLHATATHHGFKAPKRRYFAEIGGKCRAVKLP